MKIKADDTWWQLSIVYSKRDNIPFPAILWYGTLKIHYHLFSWYISVCEKCCRCLLNYCVFATFGILIFVLTVGTYVCVFYFVSEDFEYRTLFAKQITFAILVLWLSCCEWDRVQKFVCLVWICYWNKTRLKCETN